MQKTSWWTVIVVACVGAAPVQAVPTALVAYLNGSPTVERGAASTPLRAGESVGVGDVVVTDAGAKVKLLLADDSVLIIGPKTRVVLDAFALGPESRTARLRVLGGRFKIAIAKFFGGPTDYEVSTPTAVAGVRGTVLWGDTELDAICSLDGAIEVRTTNSSNGAQLRTGECVHQMGTGKTAPLTPSAEQLKAYLREVTLE